MYKKELFKYNSYHYFKKYMIIVQKYFKIDPCYFAYLWFVECTLTYLKRLFYHSAVTWKTKQNFSHSNTTNKQIFVLLTKKSANIKTKTRAPTVSPDATAGDASSPPSAAASSAGSSGCCWSPPGSLFSFCSRCFPSRAVGLYARAGPCIPSSSSGSPAQISEKIDQY